MPPDGAERRSERENRRLACDRPRLLPAAEPRPLIDPVVGMWAIQVVCWIAVVLGGLVLAS